MADGTNNYTLGKGKLYFGRLDSTKTLIGGERYIGNVSAFSVTTSSDKLDHYSSTGGLKAKDASVTLQVNRSGGFTTDNVDIDNLALFFTGQKTSAVVTALTAQTTKIKALKDSYHQAGSGSAFPSGARNISNVVITLTAAPATIVPNLPANYTVDLKLGRIYIPSTTAMIEGTEYTITFDVAAGTRSTVISKSQSIYGQVRFISDNPVGDNSDHFLPYVELSPDGDYDLISDDWRAIGFTMEVLKRDDNTESLYIDGRAAS